ncbi:ribonucleoside-diphosphate reductase subunit alpha, partial [Patescibacteria group bacterium]|nr:ribonucleoside-diphosphate reductase subunit alpha [Patescibacteria group bacterium]
VRAGRIKLYKEMKAQELWRKMVTMLFETGHPWMTFKDPCNIRSPQDHAGTIHSSNLCTEITLNTSKDEIAVCNLGSLNLSRHVGADGVLDRELLAKTTKLGMRMLDNIIDLNFYPVPETQNSNLKHRPVGLGIMGLQDVFYKMDLDFDSESAVKLSDEIMELVSYHAILSSSELAKERGSYSSYEGSKWSRDIFPIDTIDILEEERGMKTFVDKSSKMDWTPVRAHVKQYGMRNSNCMAIAPTASISNFAGCFPSIEPPYSNLYVKSNMFGEFTIANEYLVSDLKKLNLWGNEMLSLLKRFDGDISAISQIPIHVREKYKGVFSISPHWVIRHAAYRGKWIDQSQSVNIFTSTTKGSELQGIYIDAWKSGLKTTYYLRTLGASGIEKSSVEIETSQAALVSVDRLPQAEVHIEATAQVFAAAQQNLPMPMLESTPTDLVEQMAGSQYKVGQTCRMDDPTCESCQ